MSTSYDRFEKMEGAHDVDMARRDGDSEKISPLMYMLAGYLFLMIFRPYEYWPELGAWRIERVYMLCFIAAVFVSKKKKFISSPLNGSVILIAIVFFISGLFSPSWDNSWKTIEEYYKVIIFYFVAIMSVNNEKEYRFLLFSFIVVMFLYVGKSTWEFLLNGRYVWRMGIKRLVGLDTTYGAPNSFAASICYSLPLLWALIISKPLNSLMRWGLWSYGILAIVAIILTGSRSGMFTALLFFFLLFSGSSKKLGFAIFLILLLVVIWYFMPVDLQDRFLSAFMEDVGPASAQVSGEGRLIGFQQGLRLFASHPVLGIGPGNFPLGWATGMNAHNLFGQLLGELGISGVVSVGLMLLLIVLKNRGIIIAMRKLYKSEIEQNAIFGDKPKYVEKNRYYSKNMNDVHSRKSINGVLSHLFLFQDHIRMYSNVSVANMHTLILVIFKGWGDHNLYRYTWLWLAALTVLNAHFFSQEIKRVKSS